MTVNHTDREASRQLRKIAKRVQKEMRRVTGRDDIGFSLVVFQTSDTSRTSYISNCDRKDAREALRALLERWDEGMPDIPAHEIN